MMDEELAGVIVNSYIVPPKPAKAFVNDVGIYVPSEYDYRYHKILITK